MNTTTLDRALTLHPRVSLRIEEFGALTYHHDTRRLVFLKDPGLVTVVQALADNDSVEATLLACDVDPAKYPTFRRALFALIESGILCEQPH